MKLSELLKNADVKNSFADCEIVDVTQDSRLVREGFLFVCIKGNTFDGHSVAKEMLENGARAVVCEKDLVLENQIIAAEIISKVETIIPKIEYRLQFKVI